MLVIGDSPNFSNGRLGDGLAALDKLEFLVVHDTFLSPAAQRADVVLPRVTFAEKEGTFTNLERRIQRLKPALHVNGGEARPESWVINHLAQRMNAAGFDHASAAETMYEIARLAPIYAGVTYQRLEEEGVLVLRTNLESPQPTQVLYAEREQRGIQWPFAGPEAESTPTLYTESFPQEKAEVETPQFRAAEPPSDPEYPMWFVPGRVLLQPKRQAQVIRGRRNHLVQDEWVELNPPDAAGWEIEDGDGVEVHTRERRLIGRARLTESVPAGVVAATSLFGQLAVDLQASEELDPASKVAGLDISRARVVKLGAEGTQ
jgi:predicted molibdopterin-dependent oxidoreductase YjgC